MKDPDIPCLHVKVTQTKTSKSSSGTYWSPYRRWQLQPLAIRWKVGTQLFKKITFLEVTKVWAIYIRDIHPVWGHFLMNFDHLFQPLQYTGGQGPGFALMVRVRTDVIEYLAQQTK